VRAREPRGVKAIRVAHASGVLVSASRRNRLSKNSRLDKDVSCQEKVCDRETRSPARRRRVLPQSFAIVRFPQIKQGADGNDSSRINLSVRHVVMTLDVIEVDRVGDARLLI